MANASDWSRQKTTSAQNCHLPIAHQAGLNAAQFNRANCIDRITIAKAVVFTGESLVHSVAGDIWVHRKLFSASSRIASNAFTKHRLTFSRGHWNSSLLSKPYSTQDAAPTTSACICCAAVDCGVHTYQIACQHIHAYWYRID
jgi:hypothetical protein